jgi:uroporphyrinogen decarboxylase
MPTETMTPRERWLAILQRKPVDRVPMDYWSTSEATEKLLKHLQVADTKEMFARLHIDPVITVGGRYVGPQPPKGEDIYGCRYKLADYGTGVYNECIYNPFAKFNSVEEIEANYTWPKSDWWDYSGIKDQIKGHEDHPIRGGGSEPFLLYKELRGMEQAFIDLVDNPEIVHYCLDKLFDLAYEDTRRIYEAVPGRVMISYVAEDLGSQESLLYSPNQIKTFLIPRMKRMCDLVHSAGAYVFCHTDGASRDILPTLIDMGIDVLNPIQWRCQGMEREGLKRDFGSQICFHGAVDNQYTLPFGTAEEVRQEVQDNIRILGAGGGYLLAPCHNIQAVSPPENIVAMYEAGYEYGWTV